MSYADPADCGKIRLRRSSLIGPGDDPKILGKMTECVADVCIVDWEDGVLPDRKDVARKTTTEAFGQPWRCAERVIRTTWMDSEWFADDIAAAVASGVDAIMLPKVQTAEQVCRADELITEAEKALGRPQGSVEVWVLAETVQSVINADALAAAPRVTCLLFGGGDLGADMRLKRIQLGSDRTLGIHRYEYFYAYSRMVTAARAAGIDVVVTGFTSYKDIEQSRADAEISAQFGFTGALAISPRQLELYNEVFGPSKDDLAWADKVLAAVTEAAESQKAVVVVDGSMVDGPFIRNAQFLRDLQNAIDAHEVANG